MKKVKSSFKNILYSIKENKKVVIFGLVLFISYLLLTNYIQDKTLYPWNEKWFDYSVYQSYASPECFHIDPNYVKFDNNYGTLRVQTSFEKRCNFTYSIIFFHVTDLRYYQIVNENNLTINRFRNMSEPETLRIIINSTDMIPYNRYTMVFHFKLNNDFYNFFRLGAGGSSIDEFKLIYKGGLNGYILDQDSFYMLDGQVNGTGTVWRGRTKEFKFNKENNILIQSSPISKFWFLIQKIADALILGILSVIIYELFDFQRAKKRDGR